MGIGRRFGRRGIGCESARMGYGVVDGLGCFLHLEMGFMGGYLCYTMG